MYFGGQTNCGPMGYNGPMPTVPSVPQAGNYLAESNYWTQVMQAQQNLFQGWSQFCGSQNQQCQPQQTACQPQQQAPDCFGGQRPPRDCGPREVDINVNHIYHNDCPPVAEQCSPQPTPEPVPQPQPQQQPVAEAPLTRTPPSLPVIVRQSSTSQPFAGLTVSKQVTQAAHTFGAFGNGRDASSSVANSSFHNNAFGGNAVSMNLPGRTQVAVNSGVRVTGYRTY